MEDLINKFETLLRRDKVEKCRQVKIASYFVKKNLHCHTLTLFKRKSLRLMISLFFSDLSGHSSTNPQNLTISNFLLV